MAAPGDLWRGNEEPEAGNWANYTARIVRLDKAARLAEFLRAVSNPRNPGATKKHGMNQGHENATSAVS